MRISLSTFTKTIFISLLSLPSSSFAPIAFIRSSCKLTRFPHLCETCLVSYSPPIRRHSPRQLAHAALTISANRSSSASSFIRRMSLRSNSSSPGNPRGALRDCVETVDDSVDRLRQSVKEMNHMGRYGSRSFNWHLSNVQTWVSAALTDQSTCLDSLAQDKSAAAAAVRPQIRRRIVHISRLTSNSLALVNRLDPNN